MKNELTKCFEFTLIAIDQAYLFPNLHALGTSISALVFKTLKSPFIFSLGIRASRLSFRGGSLRLCSENLLIYNAETIIHSTLFYWFNFRIFKDNIYLLRVN